MSDIDKFTLLKQGAESKIYSGNYLGKPAIIKERFAKKYRHSDLDNKITKDRMKAEARAIVRCKSIGISVPSLYLVDFDRRRIYLEYFANAITVKQYIDDLEDQTNQDSTQDKYIELGEQIGRIVYKMHANDIIHGDLTSSNMLLQKDFDETKVITMIDFGLAHIDASVESKGVDLYVLERALNSSHRNASNIFLGILSSYKKSNPKESTQILQKFDEVRARGRKRTMVG